MIDNLQNFVLKFDSDIVPSDSPAGSPQNFAGNAFVVKDEVLKTETGRPYDLEDCQSGQGTLAVVSMWAMLLG